MGKKSITLIIPLRRAIDEKKVNPQRNYDAHISIGG
jgi:hypothetical protein